jgi:hypothetical protein
LDILIRRTWLPADRAINCCSREKNREGVLVMDAKMFEFWGNVFLNAARSQQKIAELNKLFGQNTDTDNSIFNAAYKNFGWSDAGKIGPEEIMNSAGRAADVYKEFLKSWMTVFDVVPKEEYERLIKENEGLREQVIRQEKIISDFKNIPAGAFNQDEIISGFTQMVEKQTRRFQELMTQLDDYHKKNTTSKKNKSSR